ncbi:hypothetical protein AGMMS49992_30530 [Clostridia bacterium]|nr:hypothetical protein AGMMS49992_30530 [Clostridia bacterium]
MKIDLLYYTRTDFEDSEFTKEISTKVRCVDIVNHFNDQIILSMWQDNEGKWFCGYWQEDSIDELLEGLVETNEWDELCGVTQKLLLAAYEDIYGEPFDKEEENITC